MQSKTSQAENLRNRKHSDPYSRPFGCRWTERGKLGAGEKRALASTTSGETLKRRLRLAELEREVSQLRSIVETLMKAVDPADIMAVIELQQAAPSSSQLRVWAKECSPPDDLLELQEERPW